MTLVRSAAEMRNSFEDMKRFIEDQDDMVIEVGNKQHEKTQKVIGGPRPQPLGTPRAPRGVSQDDMIDDMPARKRNVFKRALKGLGGRNTNDLAKIEDMLNHLLDEVADLKAGGDPRGGQQVESRGNGMSTYEHLRDGPQDGYEPEGQAGTSSTGDQSGYFSNPPSRQTNRQAGYDRRRNSENRVSTVLEEEELGEDPLEQHEQDVLDYENTEHLLTPTREMPRGGSVPLGTPPALQVPTGTQSNEHTPRIDKGRKQQKTSSSSFFPKISRWSKTTASSVADNVRLSKESRRDRPISGVSRSGSDMNDYDVNEHYDPHGEDRIRSNITLDEQERRPTSPLIPSQVSTTVSEKPTYSAHRDSFNLQHPQPRAGPTARYQNHLESQAAQTQPMPLSSPISPSSDQFGSNPVLARFSGAPAGQRHSGGPSVGGGPGNLSPISSAPSRNSMSQSGAAAIPPQRPPKIRDDGPLVPGSGMTFAERAVTGTGMEGANGNGARRTFSGGVPARKPTGPRPLVGSGSWTPERVRGGGANGESVAGVPPQRTRYRGSPGAVSYDSGEDETF